MKAPQNAHLFLELAADEATGESDAHTPLLLKRSSR
jgi:hypothetical protein